MDLPGITPFQRQDSFGQVRAPLASDIMLGEGDQVRWAAEAAEAAAWFREAETVEPLILIVPG